jgi:5-methylthioadenosine/S-adenosylhomocysteine deaminase
VIADLVITNALVVTADAAATVIRDGAVAVTGGRIARIGTAAMIGTEAREVVDARGMILMPGLINTHCHAADSLFRGLVEDLPLEPWLRQVWKAEGAILNRDTVRLGATLGFAEQALGGVTTVMDMFWHPRETVAAARAVGLRVSTGGIFFDGPGVDGRSVPERTEDAEAFFADFAGAEDVLPACMPHGAYTVGPEGLQAAWRLAAEKGGLFCTHAAETRSYGYGADCPTPCRGEILLHRPGRMARASKYTRAPPRYPAHGTPIPALGPGLHQAGFMLPYKSRR